MFRGKYKLHEREKEELGIYGVPVKKDLNSRTTADPSFVDDHQRTHLHLGVIKYCLDDSLFESALKAGCDVNARDHLKYSPLHSAAEKGLVGCVDKLLKRGAQTNTFTEGEMTPLMLAARQGHPAVVKSLLKAGAQVNLTNCRGQLALHFCCINAHQECVELLLKHKSKINYPDNDDNTPLTLACKTSSPKIVQALIDKGVRVDKADSMGRTPLHLAVLAGNKEIVRLLLDQDIYLDAVDKQYSTPFAYATFGNKPEILKMLVDAGSERSTIDGLNGTAMALAALKGHGECVRILLDAGEDPDEFGYFGMTALMSAIYESHCDITEMLLQGGANPSIVSRMGFTPIFANMSHIKPHNARIRHRQAVLLLQYGADINYRINSASVFTEVTYGKNCPMSFAITSGYISLVRLFLYAGSDIKCSEIKSLIQRDNTAVVYDIDTILGPILEFRSNPLSLLNLCRNTIRTILGPSCLKKSKSLPLAPALKDFVNLHDLLDIEPEYAASHSQLSDFMLTFINVKSCGLDSLKGSMLYETIRDPVLQAQGPGPCDCDTCERIRGRTVQP